MKYNRKNTLIFITLLLFFLLSISQLSAQVSIFNITEKKLGTNTFNKEDIVGREYTFVAGVEKFFIDSLRNYAIIQVRNRTEDGKTLKRDGYFLVLDLSSDSILWEKSFDYPTDNLYLYDSTLLYYTQNTINFISTKTGQTLLSLDKSLYYIEPEKKIALVYKTNLSKGSNIVEAIDISSGKKLWERDIERENGWDNIYRINDSILVIYSDAIYLVNINNGKGMEFKAKTVDRKYGKTILTGTLSLTLAILTGSYDIDIEEPVEINYLQSDVFYDSSYYFYASKDKLYKLDRAGGIIWNHKFRKKKISYSTLFQKDSILYMINNGYAFKDGEVIDYGIPFLAAFNQSTGEPIYYKVFNKKDGDKKNILDYKLEGKDIILVFNNSIGRYSLANGDTYLERNFINKDYGGLNQIIKDDIYLRNTGYFNKIADKYPSNYNIYTGNGYILSLNRRFQEEKIISNQDIYSSFSKLLSNNLISNYRDISIIGKDNRIILELPYLDDAILVGNKLFARANNNFIAIEIPQFK